MENQDLPNIY